MNIPVYLACDGYKTSHVKQYNPKTEVVYSTWTPRKSRIDGINEVVVFGLSYFIQEFLIDSFNNTFFSKPKDEVISEFKRVMECYSGNTDTKHWEALHDLGYLPLEIKALDEGTLCPIRVPMFTIQNTKPEFYWLTNFVETIMSTEIWKPITSATIALEYRKILDKWADKTCDDNTFVDYQAHDFSLRGMAGLDAGLSSGAGHLLSFKGSDTIPAILWLEKYYNADITKEVIANGIAGSEHSVQETNILNVGTDNQLEGEYQNLKYFLTELYPTGIFSYVADTYNFWDCITKALPRLKDEILSRDGKLVIRGDSGDPCDIICGLNTSGKDLSIGNQYSNEINKGTVELLWDIFGGTINSKGYKVLDKHIGAIYGDAITLERADEICRRLEQKGFASSNVNLGVGSYTYNMNTRDTFGFALKTTYAKVDGKELLLFKDPITDDGEKKSNKGMVAVIQNGNTLECIDNLDKDSKYKLASKDLLKTVFLNGVQLRRPTLTEIRERLVNNQKELISV